VTPSEVEEPTLVLPAKASRPPSVERRHPPGPKEAARPSAVHAANGPPATVHVPVAFSGLRLKVTLILFVCALLLALSLLIFVLVNRIFGDINPSMRSDLDWKARRGAVELAQSTDLGIAIDDVAMIKESFGEYRTSPDVLAIVATDQNGAILVSHGNLPKSIGDLFAAPAGTLRAGHGWLLSWAESKIDGNTLGRVALVISTARLDAGERLRRNMLVAASLGCLAALVVSLFFVNFYLGPLITLTHRSLRTAREMEIAKRIQTSILPTRTDVTGLEIAAKMIAADDVGGDYYDVIPVERGAWIGIGDVAGHGLQAGLIMLMVQSVVAALTRSRREATPRDLVTTLNSVLYDNIRGRLKSDEHVTFSLLRYDANGCVTFAGAHEDIIVCRAATGVCELVPTSGVWLGALRDIGRATDDSTIRLLPGDVMVLYTDGVTEAKNASGETFGLERLRAELERHRAAPSADICGAIMGAVTAWMTSQADDVTVFVARYSGDGSRQDHDEHEYKVEIVGAS
jgi:hypothetical protein